MEAPSGLGQPIATNRNARVAHIRKFVCQPPERGQTLRLLEIADPPTTLGEWPRVACVDNAATAEDVDSLLKEHASTMGCEVIANLVWTSSEALVVCSKRLKCRPDPVDGGAMADPSVMAQAETLGITGSQQGVIIQLQRALEANTRLYMSGHQTQMAERSSAAREQRELTALMGSLLKDSWSAAHAANMELDRQRERQRKELDQAALMVREATATEAADEESGARADLIRMVGSALTQALPFIVSAVGKMMTEQPPSMAANAPPAASAE